MVIPAMMPSVQGGEIGAKDNDWCEIGAKGNDGDSRDDAFSPRCEVDWCQGQ